MKILWHLLCLITGLIITISACSTSAPISELHVIDIAWQALEPNSSSHNQAAWEIVTIETVIGQEVQELFEGEPISCGWVSGPTPTNNIAISNFSSYWYVKMKPRYATPLPVPTEQYSPTAPSRIPEPFIYQAQFLIDPISGNIVARMINCIIY